MVLQNNIILQDGIPARMHFTDHHITPRTITDPSTGEPTVRNTLEFEVDRLDAMPVAARFSTMAEKLAGHFSPYLSDQRYRGFDFVITQTGEGYRRAWSVQSIPKK